MERPLISIITPTLNAADTIEATIHSVLQQKYIKIEHIFIDGKSSDNTVKIIEQFKKQYARCSIISEKDNGIYNAMNKGLLHFAGDWIYFLGSGDVFHNAYVLEEIFIEGLLNHEQVVYGNVLIQGEVSWAADGTVYDGPFNLQKLLKKNICHQAILYPRSIVSRIGSFNEKYPVTGDWDFNMHCFSVYPFKYTNKVVAVFQGGGRSSAQDEPSFYNDMPEKVIEYFHVDPLSANNYNLDSPFYEIMARYRDEVSNKAMKQITQ